LVYGKYVEKMPEAMPCGSESRGKAGGRRARESAT